MVAVSYPGIHSDFSSTLITLVLFLARLVVGSLTTNLQRSLVESCDDEHQSSPLLQILGDL